MSCKHCKFCESIPVVVPKGAGPVGVPMLGRLNEQEDTVHMIVIDREGLATSLWKCDYCPKCGRQLNQITIPDNESLGKQINDLQWKLDAVIKTQQALWEDYVERKTKQTIAPLEKSLGCKIWEGFRERRQHGE